ncbi:MAG: hypothetical protein JSS91_06525 [Bacteroidetes bacterium]|nr:hypothetical protein [Bacteroidota bacterium]
MKIFYRSLNSFLFLLIVLFFHFQGCTSDETVTPPPAGEVLVAEVSGDSVGVQSGFSQKSSSISGSTLNFTDRDSVRLTFYYSGENNIWVDPMTIFYLSDSTETNIFNANVLNILPAEQYADITIPSPKVNLYFRYRIVTNSAGFSFFKFRDLKIYKK